MNQLLVQYKALMRVLITDTFNMEKYGNKRKRKKRENELNPSLERPAVRKTSRGASNVIGFGIFGVVIIALVAFYTFIYTQSAIAAGIETELLYTLLLLSQFAVLFFGFFSALNFLYFSKDNYLLASLPIDNKVLFMAKFSMAYLSEFFISTVTLLPMLTTFGIVCITSGINVNWEFFLVELFTIIISPIAPLLVVSIISFPVMYLISFFKHRDFWNAIAAVIIMLVVMGAYFGMIFGLNSGMTDEGGLNGGMVNGIVSLSKVGIYNYLLVNAFFGIKWVGYLALHILAMIVVMALALLLSAFFYRKGMAIILEGSGAKGKAKKINVEKDYRGKKPLASFIYKEIKNILKTPMLLMNSLIALIMVPIMILIFSKIGMNTNEEGLATAQGDLSFIGMTLYITFLMMVSTNILSMSAISIEGNNFATLKTLPLSVKDILVSKLVVCNVLNGVLAIIVGILVIPLTVVKNPLIGLGTFVCLITGSIGMSGIGMRTDLRNPNLHYKNINELTKNNKRIIKPMLLAVGLGISYMILGFTLAFIEGISHALGYGIFFGVEIVINLAILFVGMKNLFNNMEEYYYRIEV